MRISVVTVTFNSIDTIADTLRSVANQSHSDIEHIIIDGGSTDGTLEAIRQDGTHVSKIVSEPDRGIYDAMNKGASLATGDMIGFLNADDMLAYSEAIADVARAATSSSATAVFGDLVYVDRNDPHRVIRRWRSGQFKSSRLFYGWMPPHPTLYVRRHCLRELGPFDLTFKIAADYDFVLRCLTRADVEAVYIPKTLVRMRVGGVSNRSFKTIIRKSREDLAALRGNRVGGLASLAMKNLRKLPQFLHSDRES